jgi:hypothetical protein
MNDDNDWLDSFQMLSCVHTVVVVLLTCVRLMSTQATSSDEPIKRKKQDFYCSGRADVSDAAMNSLGAFS